MKSIQNKLNNISFKLNNTKNSKKITHNKLNSAALNSNNIN